MDEQEYSPVIKNVIDKIITTIIKIHTQDINDRNDSECPICFNKMDLKKEQIVIYDCLHKYHRICLKNWILKIGANSKCMQCQCEKYIIINKPQPPIVSMDSTKHSDVSQPEPTTICNYGCIIL